MTLLVNLKNDRENIIQQAKNLLENADLRVMISFDSQNTRLDKTNIACPHHDEVLCNCHIVVMLVYESNGYPATLIANGQDDNFWISLTFPPGLRPSASLQNMIKAVLKPNLLKTSMVRKR